MFSDPKLKFRTEQRSYTKNVPSFSKKIRGRPPEGLENAPDILAQNFLDISDLTASGAGLAGPSQKRSKISGYSKERGSEPGGLQMA